MHIFLINKAINKNSCTPLKICSGERYDYLTKFLKLINNFILRNDLWRTSSVERMVIL